MISVQITDAGLSAALASLAERVSNLGPCLKEIGEDVAERATARFSTSTGPDGQRWKANAMATINAYIASRGGFGKRGINKKGQGLAISKKPLIATRGLSRSISYQLINGGKGVEIGTNRFADKIDSGAAIHQFGGQAGRGKKTTIPARPFLPIQQNGEIYPEEKAQIFAILNRYLSSPE